jgi:hypothetical protein
MLCKSSCVVSLTVCAFRRINIFYNAQALQFDDNAGAPLSQPLQEQDTAVSALSGVGLVLSPLQFDSQANCHFTLRTLTDRRFCRPCIKLPLVLVLLSRLISVSQSLQMIVEVSCKRSIPCTSIDFDYCRMSNISISS